MSDFNAAARKPEAKRLLPQVLGAGAESSKRQSKRIHPRISHRHRFVSEELDGIQQHVHRSYLPDDPLLLQFEGSVHKEGGDPCDSADGMNRRLDSCDFPSDEVVRDFVFN